MTAQIQTHERRRFSRVPFDAAVSLSSPAGKWGGKLIDISLKGVLMTRPQHWTGKSGDDMYLEIHPQGEPFGIRMEATVAHAEADKIGLRCLSIDLDSASHLRRLMELNLGDEEILYRELSLMGS